MKAWPRCAQGSHLRELCGTLSGALACFALSFRSVTEATVGWEIARWPGVRAQGGRQHDDGSMMGCMLDNEITFLFDHLLGASGGGALCLNVCVVCVCVCVQVCVSRLTCISRAQLVWCGVFVRQLAKLPTHQNGS